MLSRTCVNVEYESIGIMILGVYGRLIKVLSVLLVDLDPRIFYKKCNRSKNVLKSLRENRLLSLTGSEAIMILEKNPAKRMLLEM